MALTALTAQQRAYCELALAYDQARDHGNKRRRDALDEAMREMERDDPEVAKLAERYTDEELIELLEREGF